MRRGCVLTYFSLQYLIMRIVLISLLGLIISLLVNFSANVHTNLQDYEAEVEVSKLLAYLLKLSEGLDELILVLKLPTNYKIVINSNGTIVLFKGKTIILTRKVPLTFLHTYEIQGQVKLSLLRRSSSVVEVILQWKT